MSARGGERCKCRPCEVCGYRLHMAIHFSEKGSYIVKDGHEYQPHHDYEYPQTASDAVQFAKDALQPHHEGGEG